MATASSEIFDGDDFPPNATSFDPLAIFDEPINFDPNHFFDDKPSMTPNNQVSDTTNANIEGDSNRDQQPICSTGSHCGAWNSATTMGPNRWPNGLLLLELWQRVNSLESIVQSHIVEFDRKMADTAMTISSIHTRQVHNAQQLKEVMDYINEMEIAHPNTE